MALSDFAVFQEQAYSAMTEVLAQQVEKFNEASAGTILLSSAAHQGDYNEETMYANISGLVRRRNAYGTGAVTAVSLTHLTDTGVKVASGTPPVNIDPGMFKWIQRAPEEAGVVIGRQMAKANMADMLNTSVQATAVALAAKTAVTLDNSALTGGAELPSFVALTNAAAKMGDYASEIQAWVMHSTPMHKLFVNALTNAEKLFDYGNVNVIRDPFGRRFIMSDIPGLFVSGSPNKYRTLGLTAGSVRVEQNNDYTDNVSTVNGNENLLRTFQAEWSFNLGIKGFAWDKTNGGKSPAAAAIATATNWDQYTTSHKDLAGVVLITQ